MAMRSALLMVCATFSFLQGAFAICPCSNCICIETDERTDGSNVSHHFNNPPPEIFHYKYYNHAMDNIWGPLSGDDTSYLLRFTLQGLGQNTFKEMTANKALEDDLVDESDEDYKRYVVQASGSDYISSLFDTAMPIPTEMRHLSPPQHSTFNPPYMSPALFRR